MSAEDVRKLHSKVFIYGECDHDSSEDEPERHEGRKVIHIEDFGLGYTCAEPSQTICWECDTDDGEMNEFSEDGEWPCATLKALEKS